MLKKGGIKTAYTVRKELKRSGGNRDTIYELVHFMILYAKI